MKLFEIQRRKFEEAINVDCIVTVAEGAQFTNGKCVVMWFGKIQSTVVYDSMDDLKGIMCSNPTLDTHIKMLDVSCNCSVDSDLESDYEHVPEEDIYTL